MLSTREDLENELQSQLQIADNSSLFPASRLTKLIQNAYRRATDLYIWLDLVKGKTTHTQAGHEYYDYPQDFRSNTILRMEIDGENYERKNFEDYLAYKNNHPTSNFKMFANFGRQFFVWPVPTSTGTDNLDVWGAVVSDELANSTDETIFSNNKEDCNFAVVGLAFAVAMKRIDLSLSREEETSALAILAKHNKDEWVHTQRDQRIQHPKFAVPNYFNVSSGYNPVGNFNWNPTMEL